jgi:peptide chain release factor 1
MIETLENIAKKYQDLTAKLIQPETITNLNLTREISKEIASLEETVQTYRKYKQVLEDINVAKEMLKDPELKDMAQEELPRLESSGEVLLLLLEKLLIPKDPNDGKNVIIEIRGAAGGDEANIFAGDLYRMYTKYAINEGFTVELLNAIEGESGGFTQVEFLVKGHNAYAKFKYESGSHRVQRVPETETQGRIHTSTATVLVMPEVEDIDSDLDMNEVRIDITRSSGCGGQGVNTTDSAVRLTHIPTGLVVYSQTERSQIKNKEKAIKILQARLYDLKMQERDKELGAERKNKIGTGDRSEKIRTYNYPQNRVTDHRINYTTKQLDRVIEGDLEDIIDALIAEDQNRRLKEKNNDH